MGFGFRVAPGVRVYPGGRGVGVRVGGGSPVSYYARVGGGRSRSGGGRTSVAAHERQVRQAQRAEEIQAVLDLDKKLATMCEAHRVDFGVAEPAKVQPQPVNPSEIRKQLEEQELAGISVLKFAARREARRRALARLDESVAAEEEKNASEAAGLQKRWDEFWLRLEANDPQAVLPALEKAFEDNEAPAAAVSCQDSRVDVILRWPSLDDVVPEQKAALTPTGKPTIKKRAKGERAELYLEALSSHALATVKEALAVCPKIEEVGIAVARSSADPARGDQTLEPIALAILNRDDLAGINWQNINPTASFLGIGEGRIGMRGKGANKTLFGLDLTDSPDEHRFITQIAEGLESRVPEDGIPGLLLPLKVVFE